MSYTAVFDGKYTRHEDGDPPGGAHFRTLSIIVGGGNLPILLRYPAEYNRETRVERYDYQRRAWKPLELEDAIGHEKVDFEDLLQRYGFSAFLGAVKEYFAFWEVVRIDPREFETAHTAWSSHDHERDEAWTYHMSCAEGRKAPIIFRTQFGGGIKYPSIEVFDYRLVSWCAFPVVEQYFRNIDITDITAVMGYIPKLMQHLSSMITDLD